MAQLANVLSQQTQKFNVTGDTGNTVFITTGIAQVYVGVSSQGPNQSQTQSFRVLLDPVLTPGQFRKATGIVSVANYVTGGTSTNASWAVSDTAATLDDESGRTELRFDLVVSVGGANASAAIQQVSFQVTMLAAM